MATSKSKGIAAGSRKKSGKTSFRIQNLNSFWYEVLLNRLGINQENEEEDTNVKKLVDPIPFPQTVIMARSHNLVSIEDASEFDLSPEDWATIAEGLPTDDPIRPLCLKKVQESFQKDPSKARFYFMRSLPKSFLSMIASSFFSTAPAEPSEIHLATA